MDNIFVLWRGTENELDEFTMYLNFVHSLLEFSPTKSEIEVSFLDVRVTKEEGGKTPPYTHKKLIVIIYYIGAAITLHEPSKESQRANLSELEKSALTIVSTTNINNS